MKIALLATTVALSLIAGSAFAAGGKANQMPKDFGPVQSVTVHGHEMHLQGLKDKDGGEWVVMSREDAEEMIGAKFDSSFTFKDFNAR